MGEGDEFKIGWLLGSLNGFGQVGWVRTGFELRSLSGKIQVQIEFPTGSHKAEISPIAK